MKNKTIFRLPATAFLCMVLLSACYEDKGNYDYRDIDEITISGIESIYYLGVGQAVTIRPQITYTMEGDEENYTFAWYKIGGGNVNLQLLEETRDLTDWVPPLGVDTHKLVYGVTDLRTGATYYSDVFELRIVNDIRTGFLIMSELSDGSGRIDFLNYVDGELILRNVNPEGMPDYGKPLGIVTFPDINAPFVGSYDPPRWFSICIIGDKGAYRLDPADLHYDPLFDIENMILLTPPEDFYVAEIYPTPRKRRPDTQLRTNTGDIMHYSMGGMTTVMWTHGIYLNTFVNGDRFNVSDKLVMVGFMSPVIMYNTDTGSFVWAANGSSYSNLFSADYETKFKFNNTGRDLLYITGREREGTAWSVVYALMSQGSGYYLLSFRERGEQIAELDLSLAPEIANSVEYVMTNNDTNNEFFYYRTDKDVYCYNITDGRTKKVYTAPQGKEITLMKINTFHREDNPYYDPMWDNDIIIATFDPSQPDTGGTYEVYTITPLTGELVLGKCGSGNAPMSWSGFGKIVSTDCKSM